MRVDADVRARRPGEPIDPTWRRPEAVGGILRVDPALDRVPSDDDIVLGEVERLARRESELGTNDVDARHHLRDRVLDLDSRVDLEERELLTLEIDEELDGASVHVTERTAEHNRGGSDPLPERRREHACGCLLDELLISALQRAVTLTEVDDRPVRIGQQLNLDVPGPLHEPFDVQAAVSEPGLCFRRRDIELLLEVTFVAHEHHPTPPTSRGRLEQYGIPDRAGCLGGGAKRANRAGTQSDPHTRCVRRRSGLHLVTPAPDDVCRRTDEHELVVDTGFGERWALREEPITRVDGVAASEERRSDDLLDAEVTRRWAGGADLDHSVGKRGRQRLAVGIADHHDRLATLVMTGPHDANGDLTPIGDEDAS